MTELIQSDKCDGSMTEPLDVFEETRARGLKAAVKVGACRVCHAFIGMTSKGLLRPHVNWDARRARRTEDRRQETT